MRFRFLLAAIIVFAQASLLKAQEAQALLPNNDSILVTVFLKHDQTMNNVQRRDLLEEAGFREMFPPEGVDIVDHYVMMGIGQVIVVRLPPNRLRMLNRAVEHGAWGAYQTEFYVTYDLAEARRFQAEQP